MELMRLKKSGEPIKVYGFTYQGNKLHAVVFDRGRFFNDKKDQRRGMYSIPATQVVPYDVDITEGRVTKNMVMNRIQIPDDFAPYYTTSDGSHFDSCNAAYRREQEIVAKELGYSVQAVQTYCSDSES